MNANHKIVRVVLAAWAIIAAILPAALVFASDVSDAQYKGQIRVTNDGTATSGATVFDLTSSGLIDADMAADDLSDVAIQTSAGADVVFMPGWSSNPWTIFVPSIDEYAQQYDYLYSGGAAGGTTAYFPGTGGMTSDDDASLELGDNWAIEDHVWLSTTTGSNKRLAYKQDAIENYISGAGEFNMTITPPDATPAIYSSTSDGYAKTSGSSYSTIRAAATADSVYTGYTYANIGQRQFSGSNYVVERSYFYFDTSSIPDTADISSATLYLYGSSDHSATDFNITIQSGAPTYPHDPLVADDFYKDYYSGDGGSLYTSGFTIYGYNAIPLNSTGLSWLDVTGYTNFCLRSSREIAGTTAVGEEYVSVKTSEESGKEPYLSVTYSDSVSLSATGITGGEHPVKVTGNAQLLNNADFETGDPPTGWTYGGTGVVQARSVTQVKTGSYGLSLTNQAGTEGYAQQDPLGAASTYDGKTITFGCWIWCDTADAAHLAIYDNNGGGYNASESANHPGDSAWHWISVTRELRTGLTDIILRCRVYNAASVTAYFDGASAVVGDIYPANLAIYVDDMDTPVAEAFNYEASVDWSVTDNANNWSFATNNSVLYMHYHKIWVDDVLVQHIVYEWADAFNDQSAYDNDATPTFRTTSSDADLSAELVYLVPLLSGSEPPAAGSEQWEVITDEVPEPGNLYGGAEPDFLLSGFIADVAVQMELPLPLVTYTYAFGAALVLGFIAFSISMGSMEKQTRNRGSILVQALVSGLVMVYFTITGDGVIPAWTIIPFALEAFAALMHRQSYDHW
jgi:hypothetical protein